MYLKQTNKKIHKKKDNLLADLTEMIMMTRVKKSLQNFRALPVSVYLRTETKKIYERESALVLMSKLL